MLSVKFFFFFFKQKTAYEIPKRDWSSDVCSSDLVQKGAERRDAGPGADHDDRRLRIGGETEGVRPLHVGFQSGVGLDSLAKESRRDAQAIALGDLVAHGIDGE